MISPKIVTPLLICLLLAVPLCGASQTNETPAPSENAGLQIHLPREIAVKDNNVTIGRVGIVRGQQTLVAKASDIPLGRISVPEQKIIVDRPLVLSRLACSGIPASKVTLTGAEKVTVGWNQQVIKADRLVEVAASFLKQNSPTFSSGHFGPVRSPQPLTISDSSPEMEFSCRLVEGHVHNKATVQVVVTAGDKQLGVREVTFQSKYRARRAVASMNIPAGSLINSANVRIEQALSDEPEPADWQSPYGLVATRRIAVGAVIRPGMVGSVKPKVVLKRNQTVLIRIEKPGFLVTAVGKAMQDGCVGEYIKVRNVDSKRLILARVKHDATVEPVI
jgi:flagella basal body P-ring formation protein FlgA